MGIENVSNAKAFFTSINKVDDGVIDYNDFDKNNELIFKELGIIDENGQDTGVKRSLQYVEEHYDEIMSNINTDEIYQNTLNNNRKSFENFRQQASKEYDGFASGQKRTKGKNFRDAYNSFNKQVKEENQSFIDNGNEIKFNFDDRVKKESDENKRKGFNKILKCLKDEGYSGSINISGMGKIYFDRDKNKFFITNDKQKVYLSDDDLNSVINIVIQEGKNYKGNIIKKTNI